jgi:hypothetical protein
MNRRKKRLEDFKKSFENIEKEIRVLQSFRSTPQQRRFLRQLFGERSYINRQIALATAAPAPLLAAERQKRAAEANKNRSEKMKRTWRYFSSIQENFYPDKSKKVLRSEFTKRKRGLESDIPDLIWRNPSP